jgi:plastocyanin
MRARLTRLATTWLGIALVAAPAAGGADQAVTASGTSFNPASVSVSVGEKVTWTNTGGQHNVRFDNGSYEMPMNPEFAPWTVERTFNTAGTFSYYCEQHGGPNGVGMAGTVTVTDTSPAPGPGGGGGGPGPGG